MIKKDIFVETINFIRDRNDAMNKLNKAFTEEFEDSVFYPYFKYEVQMLKVLATSFDYDEAVIDDWISYFCFEIDFGRKYGPDEEYAWEKDGTSIKLGNAEELYDYLFKVACSID